MYKDDWRLAIFLAVFIFLGSAMIKDYITGKSRHEREARQTNAKSLVLKSLNAIANMSPEAANFASTLLLAVPNGRQHFGGNGPIELDRYRISKNEIKLPRKADP